MTPTLTNSAAWRITASTIRPAHLADAGWDLLALPLLVPLLAAGPRGDGRAVLVIPGWRTSDAATVPLRTYLRYLGYDARGWGHGANRGGRAAADAAVRCVRTAAEETSRPVSVIGWSLGGVVAYAVSRRRPELVDQVITLGSPLAGVPASAAPAVSIYSRRDTVVSWRASRLAPGAGRTNVEVRGSHVGLGHNPAALHAIATALANRPSTVPDPTQAL